MLPMLLELVGVPSLEGEEEEEQMGEEGEGEGEEALVKLVEAEGEWRGWRGPVEGTCRASTAPSSSSRARLQA